MYYHCRLAGSGGEGLLRGLEAEAFAGRGVHLALDLLQAGGGEGGKVELARQEAAQSSVGILDAAFLPGRVRVAEVGVDAVAPGQLGIAQELRAAVEGDSLACRGGQRLQGFADGAEDIARPPVAVGDEADKAAPALDQRGEIGVAVHPLEDQQVRLPVPDGMALTDLGRALGDGPLGRDLEAARLTAEAAAPQPPGPE